MNCIKPYALRRPRRAGFTMLELAICAAMLATLLALIGKAITAAELGLRRVDDQGEAMRTVENLLEQFLAKSWDAIDQNSIRALPLPPELIERWPQAVLDGSVTEVSDPAQGKRVTLSLHTGAPGDSRPATLTTWIYRTSQE